jgi:diguanylate cyclase (GGDEF)-like protein
MSSSQANFQLQQLVELLAVVSSFTEEESAIRGAVECAAATLEAEVAALILDGRVVASVGFPSHAIPDQDLVRVALGPPATLHVPGVGDCWTAAAALGNAEHGYLMLARSGPVGFSVIESNLIRGMARVLMLTLKMLKTLAAERILHEQSQRQAEENAHLLETLQLRQRLIETLHGIRRAITRRGPLPHILEMIVDGAYELLARDGDVVGLWLLDLKHPDGLILAQAAGQPLGDAGCPRRRSIDAAGAPGGPVLSSGAGTAPPNLIDGVDVESGRPWSLAVAVHQEGKFVGSLRLTAYRELDTPTEMDHQIMLAFAEHVSLAMTDAKTAHDMHEAFHDSLTGLASRRLFLDRLRHALALAESEPPQIAVLFIDLDHFKVVNDTLGHAAGDALLVAVAERLNHCLRDEDVAARLGGDEFAVLLQGITSPAAAIVIAERIIGAMSEPVIMLGDPMLVSASIGISFSGQGAQDIGELLRQADVAMYQAKRNGRDRHEVFTADMEPTFATD